MKKTREIPLWERDLVAWFGIRWARPSNAPDWRLSRMCLNAWQSLPIEHQRLLRAKHEPPKPKQEPDPDAVMVEWGDIEKRLDYVTQAIELDIKPALREYRRQSAQALKKAQKAWQLAYEKELANW